MMIREVGARLSIIRLSGKAFDMGTFAQRPEGSKEASHVYILWRSVSGVGEEAPVLLD